MWHVENVEAEAAFRGAVLSPPASISWTIRPNYTAVTARGPFLSFPSHLRHPLGGRSQSTRLPPPIFLLTDHLFIMAPSVLPVALQNKLLGYSRAPNSQLAALQLDV